ncbi:MAG TPA: sigma-70 family RNA polymerase sigma factor [Anaerolineales bacterium]|nr:sigma-70 family RNA polymerase sigma factor [Anaerolineales bacterium]
MKPEGINLLKAAQKLDEEALTAIFDQFAPAIFKYTLRLCHDQIVADNIVGDVFAQLLEQFGQGKGPRTNLRSYLYQTAYHLVVDRSRDNQHNAPLEVAMSTYAGGQFAPTQSQIEERVMMEALISAMNTDLTEDQRHVIILRFLEDFSLKETAEIIGKEVNNIKVIQNRGIAKLRKAMGIHMDDEDEEGESDW